MSVVVEPVLGRQHRRTQRRVQRVPAPATGERRAPAHHPRPPARPLGRAMAGPGWNPGLSYNEPLARLWGTDWAYGLKLESRATSDLHFSAVGSWIQDWEADKYDPDHTGTPSALRGANHAVSLATRFRGINGT